MHYSTDWTPGFGIGRRSASQPMRGGRGDLGDEGGQAEPYCSMKPYALRRIMAVVFVSIF